MMYVGTQVLVSRVCELSLGGPVVDILTWEVLQYKGRKQTSINEMNMIESATNSYVKNVVDKIQH